MEAKMGDRGRLTAGGPLALGARQWRWGPPGWTLKTQSLWPGEASTVPSEASCRATQRSGRGVSQGSGLGEGSCGHLTCGLSQKPVQGGTAGTPRDWGRPAPEGGASTAAHMTWKPVGHPQNSAHGAGANSALEVMRLKQGDTKMKRLWGPAIKGFGESHLQRTPGTPEGWLIAQEAPRQAPGSWPLLISVARTLPQESLLPESLEGKTLPV